MDAEAAACERRGRVWGLVGVALAVTAASMQIPMSGPAATTHVAAHRPSPWRDEGLVQRRFAEACDAVEEATGAKFPKRPGVKVWFTFAEMEGLLGVDATAAPAPGTDPAAGLVKAWAAAQRKQAEANTVYVPGIDTPASGTRALPGPASDPLFRSEAAVRLGLLGAAAAALDYARFPVAEPEPADLEAQKALLAVRAGHAAWVTDRVAASWKLEKVAKRLEGLVSSLPALPATDPPAPSSPEMDEVRSRAEAAQHLMAQASAQGRAFVEFVLKAKGSAGVDAALKAPPKTMAEIEHPEPWLAVAFPPKTPRTPRVPKPATPPAPEIPNSHPVTVSVLDPDGKPVARAVLHWKVGEKPFQKDVRKGEATITLPPEAVKLTASDAEDEDRTPLEYPDTAEVEVAAAATEATLKFKAK